jgi:hypothetical protein
MRDSRACGGRAMKHTCLPLLGWMALLRHQVPIPGDWEVDETSATYAIIFLKAERTLAPA